MIELITIYGSRCYTNVSNYFDFMATELQYIFRELAFTLRMIGLYDGQPMAMMHSAYNHSLLIFPLDQRLVAVETLRDNRQTVMFFAAWAFCEIDLNSYEIKKGANTNLDLRKYNDDIIRFLKEVNETIYPSEPEPV